MEFIFMLGRIMFFPVLVPITFLRAWFTDWEALEKRGLELNRAYDETYGPDFEIIRAIGLDPPERLGLLASSMAVAEENREVRRAPPASMETEMKLASDLLAWEEQVLTSGPEPLKLFVRFLREYRQLWLEGNKYWPERRKWGFLTNLDARERRIRGARAAFVMAVETFRND